MDRTIDVTGGKAPRFVSSLSGTCITGLLALDAHKGTQKTVPSPFEPEAEVVHRVQRHLNTEAGGGVSQLRHRLQRRLASAYSSGFIPERTLFTLLSKQFWPNPVVPTVSRQSKLKARAHTHKHQSSLLRLLLPLPSPRLTAVHAIH